LTPFKGGALGSGRVAEAMETRPLDSIALPFFPITARDYEGLFGRALCPLAQFLEMHDSDDAGRKYGANIELAAHGFDEPT
jgi:hypothetical protein